MSEFSTWPATNVLVSRDLGSNADPTGGSFSASQNRATFIVGLVCACVSLAITSLTLRWFILMRRLFRHRLILLLVLSDAFKAIWFFVFGVVQIAGHGVSSDSSFCQASGFFLLAAMESSDLAILVIALHTVLCIFTPSQKSGEGGLYPYRNWIYPFWLGLPIVMASLAFVNDGDAYVTSGTFCFLPKRPFWYRLALSWIPRYVIVALILLMYLAIYVYVHIKFRGFKNLRAGESSRDSGFFTTSRRTTEAGAVDQTPSQRTSFLSPTWMPAGKPFGSRPGLPRGNSSQSINGGNGVEPRPPWESMSFITETPLATNRPAASGLNPASTPESAAESSSSTAEDPRKRSETPTNFTSETAVNHPMFDSVMNSGNGDSDGTRDHLKATRSAIRKQLRFLFIYPIIYIIMWAFPFANHALNYSSYFVRHPVFWLNLMSTISLALQAGVNGVAFSVKERPWRRIDRDARFSINLNFWKRSTEPRIQQPVEEEMEDQPSVDNTNWWEAEGRKRKDSVWMGTDALTSFATRRQQRRDTLAPVEERSPV